MEQMQFAQIVYFNSGVFRIAERGGGQMFAGH